MPKNRKRHRQPAPKAGLFALPHRTIYTYPVYAKDYVLGNEPIVFVDKGTRDQWIADGAAVSMSRGKALRLLLNLPPKTQQSQSMGPSVIEGAADGQYTQKQRALGWRKSLAVKVREARPEELAEAA